MAFHKVEVEFNGQPLTIETGKVARQADGAVILTYGETKVLCTVVSAKKMRAGQDFFPLTVNYAEKFYSAGKIPGSFFRRERGSTERETLICRLIDRPMRPLFPKGYMFETNLKSEEWFMFIFSYFLCIFLSTILVQCVHKDGHQTTII